MTSPDHTAARPARSPRWRVAALGGAALVLIGGAAITMAASPAPSASPDTQTGTEQPADGGRPFRDGLGRFGGFAGFAGRHGGFGGGNITITAIDGSSVTLETVDGWTRTIEVTSETEITRDGETVALGDLEAGDRVRFRQAANEDGTWTITDLVVVQPTVVGTVTARDADSITIEQRDGTTVTINVDDATEYRVGRETASLEDVEVGMLLGAAGELDDDGSLDAAKVAAGPAGTFGRGHRHGPDGGTADPSATPDDESSTSAS